MIQLLIVLKLRRVERPCCGGRHVFEIVMCVRCCMFNADILVICVMLDVLYFVYTTMLCLMLKLYVFIVSYAVLHGMSHIRRVVCHLKTQARAWPYV